MLACLIAGLAQSSCSEGVLDDLPRTIKIFVTQYFPGVAVNNYNVAADGQQIVRLRNDATLIFNAENSWTEINGNGSPLPADLIFDQLPSPLYDYLESMELTSGVYSIKKLPNEIEVGLLDTSLTYDLTTQTIVYPSVE